MWVTVYDELESRLAAFNTAPFLFVGAGVSIRYLGTDGWVDLLTRMADYTGRPYAYFASKANGSLPRVASEIAQAFHEIWWSDPRFEESRERYGTSLRTSEGPLKVEVARYTDAAMDDLPKSGPKAKELRLLREAVIDGAITTNYDGLLEYLFPDFETYVGQDELLFSDSQGIGEIYKIHGSASRPESVVLSEADYEEFNKRNPYLAAKLLTIFVEHPVIFLGYSLSDEDVTDVLVSVARVLTTENLGRLRDRLIVVEWKENDPPGIVPTQIAVLGFNIPVILVTVPDFDELFSILTRIPRRIPARLLRHVKERVYELVHSADPGEQLAVVDIDDTTHIDDVEFVLGVGIQARLGERGYVGLTREDLLTDSLRQVTAYDAKKVVGEAIPRIMRAPGNVPIYRYLRSAGLLNDDGALLADDDVDSKIAQRVKLGIKAFGVNPSSEKRANSLVDAAGNNFGKLIELNPVQDVLMAVSAVSRSGLELEQLRQYLVENEDAFHTNMSTLWAKAVCLYDYYRFGAIDPKKK